MGYNFMSAVYIMYVINYGKAIHIYYGLIARKYNMMLECYAVA